MSKFKGSEPFGLTIVALALILGAAVLIGFYFITVTRTFNANYRIQFSMNLNDLGTETMKILEYMQGEYSNMELMSLAAALNSDEHMTTTADDTLKKMYVTTKKRSIRGVTTEKEEYETDYDMMLHYDIGFLYRYGETKPNFLCGAEPGSKLVDSNGATRFKLKWPGERPYNDPGAVSDLQGPRYIDGRCQCHAGMDFAFNEGSKIYATYAGEILSIDWDEDGYGLLVIMGHWVGKEKEGDVADIQKPNPDFYTRYGHLYLSGGSPTGISLPVDEGDWVSVGDIIARSGNTGKSTGAHLHLEIRNSDDEFMNPCIFLEDRPVECELFTDKKPQFCGDYKKADLVVFEIPVPGAIMKNGKMKTKGIGVLYRWQ